MQKILIPLLICLTPFAAGAQSLGRVVVGAGGATYSNGNGGLSVTIGEICVQRYSNNSNVVTEGFLQPGLKGGAAPSIESVKRADAIALQVYPNPTTSRVVTVLTCSASSQVTLDLFDGQGKLMMSRQVLCNPGANPVEWNIGHFSAGTYLIKARNMELPVMKIVKE